jgi:uncharacterized membrane protein
MSTPLLYLTALTAIGSAVVGGALYAFSSFVMPGLDRTPPATAIAAMQGINVEAPKPPFLASFVGTAVLSIACVVAGVVRLDEDGAPLQVAGGLLYLVGVIGLTGAYHIPRNDALDRVDPGSPEAEAAWRRYHGEWVRMNHVRSAAGMVAAALLIAAVRVG